MPACTILNNECLTCTMDEDYVQGLCARGVRKAIYCAYARSCAEGRPVLFFGTELDDGVAEKFSKIQIPG